MIPRKRTVHSMKQRKIVTKNMQKLVLKDNQSQKGCDITESSISITRRAIL